MRNSPSSKSYDQPVAALLSIGRDTSPDWPNYPATYHLTHEHIPELIRMLHDNALNLADSESDEVYAPIHAWRALGQLGDETAVPALINILPKIDEDNNDWEMEEMPRVFALMGPAALPALTTYLDKKRQATWSRTVASHAVRSIAEAHPDVYDRCVAIIANQLQSYQFQDNSLNASLVYDLVEMEAMGTIFY